MGKRQRKRVRQLPLSAESAVPAQTSTRLDAWWSPSPIDEAVASEIEQLAQLVEEQRRLTDRQRELVAHLVAAGTGWPRIASALGISRQAARQQFVRTHGTG